MPLQYTQFSATAPQLRSVKRELDDARRIRRDQTESHVREHALIVDASGEIATRVQRWNSDQKRRIVAVESAEEAYVIVRSFSLFIVMIHPDLPDESGWLVAAKLRLTSPQSQIWMYGISNALPEEHLATVGATGRVDAASVGIVIGPFLRGESETRPPHYLIPSRRSVCPQDSSVLSSSSR